MPTARLAFDLPGRIAMTLATTLVEAAHETEEPTAGAETETPELPEGEVGWRAVLAVEGVETDDRRIFDEGALVWRDLPLPLMANLQTTHGHEGAMVAGRITEIVRDGSRLLGRGVFDAGEDGREVARQVALGNVLVVSIDAAAAESFLEEDERGMLERYSEAVILGATVTPFPALREAIIELDLDGQGLVGGDEAAMPETEPEPAVTAAAAPVRPPRAWFDPPTFVGPTPLTVSAEGRVMGHIAAFGTCHTGYTDTCVCPPRSATNYANYLLGSTRTAEGDEVATGAITMNRSANDAGHPGLELSAADARRYYDNACTVVADVVAGEDDHGIWVAGALSPDVSDEEVRRFMASPLSGDWRPWGSSLELVAVQAVPVPGFPVLRARVASGRVMALVAAGARPLAEASLAERQPVGRAQMEALERRVAAVEALVPHLTPIAADAARRRVLGDS